MKNLAMKTKVFTYSRRGVSLALAASLTVGAWHTSAAAFDVSTARTLVDKVVAEINAIIDSGDSEPKMLADFESIFVRYADVPIIARSALGIAAKSASSAQLNAFTRVFQGYISRKYGRRFREFIDGRIEVTDAQPLKSYFEVVSIAILKDAQPFDLRWHVSSKSGQDRFFNLVIEGVNLLTVERVEIGALLDKNKGNLDALIENLKRI
jgi:phospholipid transport system substrate-binding protein